MNKKILKDLKSSSTRIKKTVALSIRVTKTQHAELVSYCARAGVSQNKVIVHLLKEFIFKK